MLFKNSFLKKASALLISSAIVLSVCVCPVYADTKASVPNASINLTKLYSDLNAYKADTYYLINIIVPKYKKCADSITDIKSLVTLFKCQDELYIYNNRLATYFLLISGLDSAHKDYSAVADCYNNANIAFSMAEAYATDKLKTMDNKLLKQALSDTSLKPYYRQLSKLSNKKSSDISDEESEMLMPALYAVNAFKTEYNILCNNCMDFPTVKLSDGTQVVADYSALVSSKSLSPADRVAVSTAYFSTYEQLRHVFAANLNSYFSLEEQYYQKMGYGSTFEYKMIDQDFTEEGYNALLISAKANAEMLKKSAEYGKAFVSEHNDTAYIPTFTYEQAKEIVINATMPLGNDYTAVLKKSFNEGWIDAVPAPNKDSGAFAVSDAATHPYVMLNFDGSAYSVDTLAHELGHAVNQYMSLKKQQSLFNRGPSSIVSEVASTTNEFLLYSYLQDNAKSDVEKLYYTQQEIEMINSAFFAQASYADLERQMRKLVEDGESLTADTLDELNVELDELYTGQHSEISKCSWAGLTHLYNDYYVYQYAVSAAAACSIADKIKERDSDAIYNYNRFLAAGDSMSTAETYKIIGVDINDPAYTTPIIEEYKRLLRQETQLKSNITAAKDAA